MKLLRGRGFTIVELIVVVAVIGVLSTVTYVAFGQFTANARDAQRKSSVTVISEALEKYYQANGEYPSCPNMTTTPDTISASTLINIDKKVFKAPTDSASNSVNCGAITLPNDKFGYVGDGSSSCTSGAACLSYTLQYKSEVSGNIVSVTSQYTANLNTSTVLKMNSIAAPTCSVAGFTSLPLTWSTTGLTADVTGFEIQAADNIGFSGGTQFSNIVNSPGLTSYTYNGLSAGKTWYFRVRAVTTGNAAYSFWSTDVNNSLNSYVSQNTLSDAISNFTAGTITSNSMVLSWTNNACNTGYTLERATSSDYAQNFVSTPLSANTTSSSISSLSPGTPYYFRLKLLNTTGGSYTSTGTPVTGNPISTSALPPTCSISSVNSSTSTLTFNFSTANTTSSSLEWGLSTAYGALGSPISNPTTGQIVSGLSSNTQYFYRLSVTGAGGGPVYCTGSAWTSPVVACSVTQVSGGVSITFSGASSYTIDYGPTTAYGTNTGAATSPTAISGSQGATIYFRVNGTGGGSSGTCIGSGVVPNNPTCSFTAYAATSSSVALTVSSTNFVSVSVSLGSTQGGSNYATGSQTTSSYTLAASALPANTIVYYTATVYSSVSGLTSTCGGSATNYVYTSPSIASCSVAGGNYTFTPTYSGTASSWLVRYGTANATPATSLASSISSASGTAISVATGGTYYVNVEARSQTFTDPATSLSTYNAAWCPSYTSNNSATVTAVAAPTCTFTTFVPTSTTVSMTVTATNATSIVIGYGLTQGSTAKGTQTSTTSPSTYTLAGFSSNQQVFYTATVTGTGGSATCGGGANNYVYTMPVVTCSATGGTLAFTPTFSGASTYVTRYGTVSATPATSLASSSAIASGTAISVASSGTWYYNVSGSSPSYTDPATSTATTSTAYCPSYTTNNSVPVNALPSYTFSKVAGTGGTVSGTANSTYSSGTAISITATPNTGYAFSSWSGTNCSSASATYSFSLTAATACTANFVATYVLTVSAGANGTASGGGTFVSGSTPTITATPNSGYVWSSWTGTGCPTSASGALSTGLTANRTCTANFALSSYTVSLTSSPAGSGTLTGAGTYSSGTLLTITATANSGYSFSSWSGSTGCSGAAAHSLTVNANISCTASFSALPTYSLSLSVSPAGYGTTSASPSGPYTSGTSVTLSTSASPVATSGYYAWFPFSTWSPCASPFSITSNTSCTATYSTATITKCTSDVAGLTTVSARFCGY
jgi:prepilin-type N-terminal cleavage/methylation domain-containing protein